jgi:hypothetical protein
MYRTILAVALLVASSPSCNPPPDPVTPPAPAPAPIPTIPPPLPVVDAGPPAPPPAPAPGDAYDDACAAMKAAGCHAGADPTCAATMRHADHDGITKVPVACLGSAKTKAAVRACGFTKCAP